MGAVEEGTVPPAEDETHPLASASNGPSLDGEASGRDGGRQASALLLASEWDAALTYDVLNGDEAPNAPGTPVFVGRRELLGPLVNAISKPDRRGTYLVSGYRGAGKTSLVIEAAWRAKPNLAAAAWTLLPLVLNVSEVSASLSAASKAGTPPLGIDARRLLTALLRALRNGYPSKDDGPIARAIDRAYRKAEASSYTETARDRAEASAARTVETTRSLAIANVLKLVALFAALGAVVLEGVAVLGTSMAALQIACLALAGVAVVSYRTSTTTSSKASSENTTETQSTWDNSLQQVEIDLKDILDRLAGQHLRLMFVLEELDKVDDKDGAQLDAVIRYFKNLFTQAPALFFFLTDKDYFDVVDRKIADSRRDRSYAVEHTFFTHRVFVSRPSLDECLRYFARVVEGVEVSTAIKDIRESEHARSRSSRDMTLLERFLRVLLFNSQNHFFDLKDEMRNYLTTDEGGSWLDVDAETFPEQVQALAGFHFLIEQKMTLYGFSGGRQYANEMLRTCLTEIFAGIGTDGVQDVQQLYPGQLIGPGSELGWSERTRIVDAVNSLFDELTRGGAIDMELQTEDRERGTFRWRADAAVRFRPSPMLEPHEQDLYDLLEHGERIAGQFGETGPLFGLADAAAATEMAVRYRRLADAVRAANQPMSREEAGRQSGEVASELTALVGATRILHQQQLAPRGWMLSPTGSDPNLWWVTTKDADEGTASVLLVYGPEAVDPEVAQSAAQTQATELAAILLIADDPEPDPKWRRTLLERWRASRVGGSVSQTLVAMISLAEEVTQLTREETWGRMTGDELYLARWWLANFPKREDKPLPNTRRPAWLIANDGTEIRFESLTSALLNWLTRPERVLGLPDESGGDDDDAIELAVFELPAVADAPVPYVPEEDDAPPADVVERLQARGRLMTVVEGEEPFPSAGRVIAIGVEFASANFSSADGWMLFRASDSGPAFNALADFIDGVDPVLSRRLYETAAQRGQFHAILRLLMWSSAEGRDEDAALWADRLIQTGESDAMREAARRLGPGPISERLLAAAAERSESNAPSKEDSA